MADLGENFAGSIIVSLASLPDFLRQPILSRRMREFFSLSAEEKQGIIRDALEAGPGVEFARFEKLFKTWLEVLASLPAAQRSELVSAYMAEIVREPGRLVAFNLDAVFGVFLTLTSEQQETVAASVREAAASIDEEGARVIRLLVPDVARRRLGMLI